MTSGRKGIHIRQLGGALDMALVGPSGLIQGDSLRVEIIQLSHPRKLHFTEQPVLGITLPGHSGRLSWGGKEAELPVWSWFYLPRDHQAEIRPREEGPISVLLFMPVQADEARWESSAQGSPVVVALEELWTVIKEGRVCFNAAGDGFPIDRPYFMGSYCVYDLKHGEMPQHVHQDQEEFMIIFRSKGTHSGFLIGDHSLDLDDWTLIHAFQGAWHGFAPAEDGLITIVGLYLEPVPGGGANAQPISRQDLDDWLQSHRDLSDVH
jgi:hypothetical protein